MRTASLNHRSLWIASLLNYGVAVLVLTVMTSTANAGWGFPEPSRCSNGTCAPPAPVVRSPWLPSFSIAPPMTTSQRVYSLHGDSRPDHTGTVTGRPSRLQDNPYYDYRDRPLTLPMNRPSVSRPRLESPYYP